MQDNFQIGNKINREIMLPAFVDQMKAGEVSGNAANIKDKQRYYTEDIKYTEQEHMDRHNRADHQVEFQLVCDLRPADQHIFQLSDAFSQAVS